MARTELKLFRIRNLLYQKQMAERLNVSRSTYIAVENGNRNPKQAFWDQLQKNFNVSDADMWALMKKDEIQCEQANENKKH